MKLFAAVALDDRVRDAAAALVEECRIRAGRLAPKARITWVASDRLHVTVRVIGVVDDGRAAAIREALSPPLAMPPFECTITGTGAFPGRGQPRVIARLRFDRVVDAIEVRPLDAAGSVMLEENSIGGSELVIHDDLLVRGETERADRLSPTCP